MPELEQPAAKRPRTEMNAGGRIAPAWAPGGSRAPRRLPVAAQAAAETERPDACVRPPPTQEHPTHTLALNPVGSKQTPPMVWSRWVTTCSLPSACGTLRSR